MKFRTHNVYSLTDMGDAVLMVTTSDSTRMVHFSAEHEARIDLTVGQLRCTIVTMVERLRDDGDLGDLPLRLLGPLGLKIELTDPPKGGTDAD